MAENWRSHLITGGIARSPNRAMLRAVGFTDDGLPIAVDAELAHQDYPIALDRLRESAQLGKVVLHHWNDEPVG